MGDTEAMRQTLERICSVVYSGDNVAIFDAYNAARAVLASTEAPVGERVPEGVVWLVQHGYWYDDCGRDVWRTDVVAVHQSEAAAIADIPTASDRQDRWWVSSHRLVPDTPHEGEE